MDDFDPYTSRLFQIESGGNPYAVTGSNVGLGQFGPEEQKQYGITDPYNPQQQADAVARERANHTQVYQTRFGSDPTPGQLYLMHQQGVAGGPALMGADPNTPAWQAIRPYYRSDAIAQRAITGNIPRGSPLYGQDVNSITAGDFSKFWISKFEGGQPSFASNAPTSSPPTVSGAAPVSAAPTAAAPGNQPNPLGSIASNLIQQEPLKPAPTMQLSPLGAARIRASMAQGVPFPSPISQALVNVINGQS